ncbi:MAG TPA: hypothetical protein VGN88_12670 [Phycisphaerae bacterium]
MIYKMLRAINNLLYRRKDPTRLWRADAARVSIDLRRCTLCGRNLGTVSAGAGAEMECLGATEDAKKASRGYLEWYSKGVYALLDADRLYDFTVIVAGGQGSRYGSYTGKFLREGQELMVSRETTAENILEWLGEPFAKSERDDLVLFYEYGEGEVQYAFDEDWKLESVEFGYEPELGVKKAREYYGIERELPAEFNRTLG